jgi:hypothetical protein
MLTGEIFFTSEVSVPVAFSFKVSQNKICSTVQLIQTPTIELYLKCPYFYPIQGGALACTIFSTTLLVTPAAVSKIFFRTALLWIALISKAVLS